MMLHTFSTLGCPELDLDGAIALAGRHGLHALELRVLGGTTDLPAWLAQRYGEPGKFAAHLKQKRAKVCALNTSFKLIGSNDVDRADLVRFIDWADAAEVPWLRVFDGGRAGDPADVAEAAETYKWLRAERRKRYWAVDFLVETHDAFVRAAALRDLIARAPDIALLWDAHHTWRLGNEAPGTTWAVIGKHTRHVHVKDSVSRPSPTGSHPFTYVLPGEGEFPMGAVRDALVQTKFGGVLSLEWDRQWHPYLPELDKALYAASRAGWW
jgi:sugar phosphate isomerase/epimerase